MTDLIIKKTENLSGTINAPPSKAHTHRAIIGASLSEGRSLIKKALICDDTLATINACSMLGANIKDGKEGLKINGLSSPSTPEDVIHCKDSGSTMRFITPICALAEGISIITGNEGLRKRPMKPLVDSLRRLGVQCYSTRQNGYPPIIVFGGGIKGGNTSIRGDVSSQFISGLLFGAPKAYSNTEIIVTTPLESKPYVKMTLAVLSNHGIQVEYRSNYKQFIVPCEQEYKNYNHVIEGDYSSSAFLFTAATITDSQVKVTNLKEDSMQGDKMIVNILKLFGSTVIVGKNSVEIQGKQELKGIDINVQDIPDLAPVCAVIACIAHGKTIIRGGRRLRYKESDRISALSSELRKMGGRITEFEDGLLIEGRNKLHGAEIDSHNDHRIAMACTIAALIAEGDTIVHGIECVNKSYPDFLVNMRELGSNFKN